MQTFDQFISKLEELDYIKDLPDHYSRSSRNPGFVEMPSISRCEYGIYFWGQIHPHAVEWIANQIHNAGFKIRYYSIDNGSFHEPLFTSYILLDDPGMTIDQIRLAIHKSYKKMIETFEMSRAADY